MEIDSIAIDEFYNSFVADSLKVPADEFKAVIRALLDTPPIPMADIPRKREPNVTAKRTAKKRGYWQATRSHAVTSAPPLAPAPLSGPFDASSIFVRSSFTFRTSRRSHI